MNAIRRFNKGSFKPRVFKFGDLRDIEAGNKCKISAQYLQIYAFYAKETMGNGV